MTSPVDEILARVGPAVLLMIPRERKGPKDEGWQKRTLAQQDAARLDELRKHVADGGNLGVALGQASGGLCTIDFDDAAAETDFFALNPGLRGW